MNYLITILIFVIIFLIYRYFKVQSIKKHLELLINENVKNWKPIFPPPGEQYVIVRGKELKDNDIIIQNGFRFKVNKCSFGTGAGSYEFGEYISLIGSFINTNPTDLNPIKNFWVYQDSPIVKCVHE